MFFLQIALPIVATKNVSSRLARHVFSLASFQQYSITLGNCIMSFEVRWDAKGISTGTSSKNMSRRSDGYFAPRQFYLGNGGLDLSSSCAGSILAYSSAGMDGHGITQRQPNPTFFTAESSFETLLLKFRFFFAFKVFRTSRKAMLTLARAVSESASIQPFLAGIKNRPP